VIQIFFVRLRDLRGFVVARLRARLHVSRFGEASPPRATPAAGNADEVASLRGRKNV
jgi:hypothetical protein